MRAYRYGLTDIQEYYANTGALKKAAENNSEGRKVGETVVRSSVLPSTLLYSTATPLERVMEMVNMIVYQNKMWPCST